MNDQLVNTTDQVSHAFHLESIWNADTQNHIFRSLMQAMSRPGSIQNLEPQLEKSNTVTAVLVTLSDAQVTACNHDSLISDADWSLSQCQTANPEASDYIVCDGSIATSIKPKLGSLESPDTSSTFILAVNDFTTDVSGTDSSSESNDMLRWKLTGPGIEREVNMTVYGLHPSWIKQRQDWNSQFPMGVDFVLASATSVVALPRTTKLECLL